jgi:exopolysaccharide production protein ExoQ
MMTHIATVVYFFGIIGLFVLNRDQETRSSKALWIPVLWLLICGSRNVSEWMGGGVVSTDQYLEGSPLDRNIFAAILILGVFALFGRGERVRALLRSNWAIILFFLYCLISIGWSEFPVVAFKRWTKAMADVVMVLIVLTDDDPVAALKRVFARIGFLLIPTSIFLIKYYPSLGRVYVSGDGSWMPAYTGVTNNKNLLGMVCLVVGIGMLWSFIDELKAGERQNRRLLAQGTILAMVCYLLWLANSMTSLLCFLLAAPLILTASIPGLASRRGLVRLLILSVPFVCFAVLFLQTGSGLLTSVGRDSTLTGRTELWSQVLDMKTNPIIGTGFESFWLGERIEKLWSIYWWHPNEAHDGYLEIYLNLGWVGLTFLAIMLIAGYRRVVNAVGQFERTAGLRMAVLSVALAYNFTEAAFKMLNPVWIFLLVALFPIPEIAEGWYSESSDESSEEEQELSPFAEQPISEHV